MSNFPLGFSDLNLVYVTCFIAPVWPQKPRKRKYFGRYNSAKWEDLRQYYSDFPCDEYCFHVRAPSLCAESLTEVIVFCMESYIPHNLSNIQDK